MIQQAWATQLQHPQGRTKVAEPVPRKVGAGFVKAHLAAGEHDAVFISFGDYDAIFIMEASDNVSAAGLSMALSAGGAVKAMRSTPPMSIEDGILAMNAGPAVSLVTRSAEGENTMDDVRRAAATVARGDDIAVILSRNAAGWHRLLDKLDAALDGRSADWSEKDQRSLQERYAALLA